MDSAAKIEVHGLRELQKVARQAGAQFAKELRTGQKALAETIVAGAQSRASSLPGKAGSSFAAGLKAKGEQRNAKVVLDGTKAPTLLGDEFGAKRFHQFEAWRGNQYTDPLSQGVGYALHPELRAEREQIMRAYEEMVDHVLDLIARG